MKIRSFSLSRHQLILTAAITMVLSFVQTSQAQTYTVLHRFTAGVDGATPYSGLIWDGGANFYGTTSQGGYVNSACFDLGGGVATGCGVVYRLRRSGSDWTFSTIYEFRGGTADGNSPLAPITIARDGTLYGTTWGGHYNGSHLCRWIGHDAPEIGCGIVYQLRPPATTCKTALCSWNETIVWALDGTVPGGGAGPSQGQAVFDRSGNLYITGWDSINDGEVFQLVPSGGSWMVGNTYVMYSAGGDYTPLLPLNNVVLDTAGNVYTTSELGQENMPNCGSEILNGCGTVFQLTPTSSGWTETTIYQFTDGEDGKFPIAGLISDQAGNLYGVTSTDGPQSGGTVFELSPSGGSWTYHVIYALPNGYPQEGTCFIALETTGCSGPWGSLLMDSAGNLYGASYANGLYHYGNVFKLTHSNGSWTYTDLYDFTGGTDGAQPAGQLILDDDGNLYGTTLRGGGTSCDYGAGCGVVFEITP